VPNTAILTHRGCRMSTRVARFIAAAIGCLALAACAGESPTPPPSPTATPTSATYSAELCAAAAEYQTAANAIVTLNASAAGAEGVKTALQNLQTAADNLQAAAQAQFGPQVAELERAIASLRGTIAGLSDQDSLSTNLGKITASVSAVEQAAKPIVDSVRTGCPSVPPVQTPPAS
jgi:hypothetical protein